jgi:hypothetical protein
MWGQPPSAVSRAARGCFGKRKGIETKNDREGRDFSRAIKDRFHRGFSR